MGLVLHAKTQLMTVADAAALAGAQQLANPDRLNPSWAPATDMGLATSHAVAIGQSNTVLGTAAVVNIWTSPSARTRS